MEVGMAYVSEVMGRPVADVEGERIGKVKDLLAMPRGGIAHPQISALVVQQPRGKELIVPIADVMVLLAPAIPLNKKLADIIPYQPGPQDLFLVQDVLDRQIIDIDGVRVVRVNDLELTRVNGEVYVSNVDISAAGLMRRLGLGRLVKRPPAGGILRSDKASGSISWDDVELLPGDAPMRLKVSSEKLSELHPADLAEIISDLNRAEGRDLLEKLDAETAAEALEEVEPEFQASLVEGWSNEKVADVLDEMAPDEAADLLAELPQERSQELLNLMEKDEAADVRLLLSYPEESAGGIMNTEFIAVRAEWTAAQVLDYLRQNAEGAETIYYLYVTDEASHLMGVFSLRELVLSKPKRLVSEIMQDRVLSVSLLDPQEEIAQLISKYNLLAIPVVDDKNVIHGIVTADDALDKIIPTAWKKRLPRLYH
jgi:magnesium transporter